VTGCPDCCEVVTASKGYQTRAGSVVNGCVGTAVSLAHELKDYRICVLRSSRINQKSSTVNVDTSLGGAPCHGAPCGYSASA
jgi:hypothetical protein